MLSNGCGDDSGTLLPGFVDDDFSHDTACLLYTSDAADEL